MRSIKMPHKVLTGGIVEDPLHLLGIAIKWEFDKVWAFKAKPKVAQPFPSDQILRPVKSCPLFIDG